LVVEYTLLLIANSGNTSHILASPFVCDLQRTRDIVPTPDLFILFVYVFVNGKIFVKIEEGGLDLFFFSFFYFILFSIYFLFLEQLGLELIGHAITSVT